jgi:hypothetical protein
MLMILLMSSSYRLNAKNGKEEGVFIVPIFVHL